MSGEWIEQALREWAHWVTLGRTADGFPRRNVLHSSWMPPAPGNSPAMKVSRSNDRPHRAMHAAIGRLSLRMSNTVVVHYCYRLSVADQCARLGCAPSTLHQRLVAARKRLAEDVAAAN